MQVGRVVGVLGDFLQILGSANVEPTVVGRVNLSLNSASFVTVSCHLPPPPSVGTGATAVLDEGPLDGIVARPGGDAAQRSATSGSDLSFHTRNQSQMGVGSTAWHRTMHTSISRCTVANRRSSTRTTAVWAWDRTGRRGCPGGG